MWNGRLVVGLGVVGGMRAGEFWDEIADAGKCFGVVDDNSVGFGVRRVGIVRGGNVGVARGDIVELGGRQVAGGEYE